MEKTIIKLFSVFNKTMSQFLRKVVVFLTIPVIFILVVLIGLNFLVKTDYKIKPDINSLFIGDSHIQQTFNDNLIPQSLNCGIASESFYFSYFKLKYLLDENPSIKNVYLGLSFHSLSNYYERFISGDYSASVAPKYFFILPWKEQLRLIYWNKANFVSFLREVLNIGFYQVFNGQVYPFIGGYLEQFSETFAVDSSMNKRLKFQYFNNGKLNSFSQFNIYYLNKIISLCKKQGVHLVMVNTPLHEYYYKKIPKKYKDELFEIVAKNHLNYIDFSKLQLKDNCFTPDGDHVSTIGAVKTSKMIKVIIDESQK
ncbi:hypothetical protein AAGV28_01030 [Flavobacterium sp. FZUC8N2.13]|uniref:SGNH/GDSL hydrolase family protein n=1 Tax=Flavobacterium zubiriense TaxID=3138075 RepID=A0ABV4T735_9FLAO